MDTIYFCDDASRIKIGFSSTHKSRLDTHFSSGLTLRAIVQGGYANEQEIHKHFRKYRLSFGKENFEPVNEIYEYIDALLANGFAASKIDGVEALPNLPYTVWRPDRISYKTHKDGQQDMWGHLPAKERVQYLSDYAYLNSQSDEWYTPESLIKPVLKLWGKIDLDPATTGNVNDKWIKAEYYYTKEVDGLSASLEWFGRVWLNPPYGRGNNSAAPFADRLVKEFNGGNVAEAITCLNINSTTSQWFQPIWQYAAVHCICKGRPNFISPDGDSGGSPNKGTILSYFGPNDKKFCNIFGKHGTIISTC
ncbi:MAG TPA: hypothetical protein ENH62_16035 [Marinobacter sp.]|uniref:Uncharacterized protein n=1 Tax=marine sediment metagenome TaxID=412755 RepID=A0A0F9UFY2_9ZZZZ|nr:hypothetical protein [Marinobacter sp.]